MDAYSEDLRKKIVQALEQRRMNKSEAARAFGVSLSSVKRYAKATGYGSLRVPRPYDRGRDSEGCDTVERAGPCGYSLVWRSETKQGWRRTRTYT
jgi:transposase